MQKILGIQGMNPLRLLLFRNLAQADRACVNKSGTNRRKGHDEETGFDHFGCRISVSVLCPHFSSVIFFTLARTRLWFRHRYMREVAEVATLRTHRVSELLRAPLPLDQIMRSIRPAPPFFPFIFLSPGRHDRCRYRAQNRSAEFSGYRLCEGHLTG